jgi:hypothetical protein
VRDYSGPHQAIRRALLPDAYGRACHFCGRPMLPGQLLDLDHAPDGSGYRGMSHRSCNRRDGARRGAMLRRRRRERIKRMGYADVIAAVFEPFAERERAEPAEAAVGPDVVLGVSISEDRRRTSICGAGFLDGDIIAVALLRYLDGVRGAVDAVLELRRERQVSAVVVDPHGPAATLIQPLTDAGVTVTEPNTSQVSIAHNGFKDLVDAGRLRHGGQPELTDAVRHGTERALAGSSAWARRGTTTDMSPAEAAELAAWGLTSGPAFPPAEVFI